MSSIAVFPPGFTAALVVMGTGLVLMVALAVLWLRGKALRGPIAALLATLVLFGLLVAADVWRFRAEAIGGLLRLADDWAFAWPGLAAAIWFVARR